MQIYLSEVEDERGGEDQEHKGKFSEKGACINQRDKSFAKLFANLPNDMVDYENPSTPLLLQVILSLSANIIKDSYQHIGGNMSELPDMKKQTVAAAVVRKWGERIWVMGSEAKAL